MIEYESNSPDQSLRTKSADLLFVGVMRVLLLALLITGVDLYAFQALRPYLIQTNDMVATTATVVYWLIPVFAFSYAVGIQFGYLGSVEKRTRTILSASVLILYFSKLITGIVLLLDDIRRVVAVASNGLFPQADFLTTRLTVMGDIGLMLGIAPAALLIYGILRNPYRYRIRSSDIQVEGLPHSLDGLRVVQISDIHAGSLYDRKKVSRSVELINSLDPDIVCFTGDLVNSVAEEIDPYIPVFSEINPRFGVYSVLGNHDYGDYVQWPDETTKRENFRKLQDRHRQLGWDLLINDHRTIDVHGNTIAIIGVENYSANPRFHKYGDMARATNGLGSRDLTILLSHDPTHWDDEILTKYQDVDLTLSGHTHGFQFGFEIDGVLKWSPVQYVYRRWSGLYREGKQHLYINRGLGFLGYPGRVGILPEITLLTIRRKPEA